MELRPALKNGKKIYLLIIFSKKITKQTFICPVSRLGGGHPGHGQCEQHSQRDLHLDSVRELGTVTRITGHLSGISLFLTIHFWDCWNQQIIIAITALCYHFLYCASKQGKFQGKDGSISPFSFTFWIFLKPRPILLFQLYCTCNKSSNF